MLHERFVFGNFEIFWDWCFTEEYLFIYFVHEWLEDGAMITAITDWAKVRLDLGWANVNNPLSSLLSPRRCEGTEWSLSFMVCSLPVINWQSYNQILNQQAVPCRQAAGNNSIIHRRLLITDTITVSPAQFSRLISPSDINCTIFLINLCLSHLKPEAYQTNQKKNIFKSKVLYRKISCEFPDNFPNLRLFYFF